MSFHRNKFIHILCVPMIFWSAAAIITHYSVHIDLNLGHKALEFNYAVVFCAVLSAVYLYVDFFSGVNLPSFEFHLIPRSSSSQLSYTPDSPSSITASTTPTSVLQPTISTSRLCSVSLPSPGSLNLLVTVFSKVMLDDIFEKNIIVTL